MSPLPPLPPSAAGGPTVMYRPTLTGLLALLMCGALAGGASAQAEWSAQQRATLRTLGPWPPPFVPDPGDRVSGHPLAIELGRRLFNDPRMSPVGYIACVTCHQSDRSLTDIKARAHGLADLPRNTIALADLRQQRWYGWGGSSDSLWMASLRPMLDSREFDSKPAIVARLYRRDEDFARCYRAVFGSSPLANPERVMVNTGKALAAFQEALRSQRSAFDDYRDAVSSGRPAAAYPAAAQRGLALFVGTLGCVRCHSGPTFTDGRVHRIADASADPGRLEGLDDWRSSRFNLRGPYNDGALPPPRRCPRKAGRRNTALDRG